MQFTNLNMKSLTLGAAILFLTNTVLANPVANPAVAILDPFAVRERAAPATSTIPTPPAADAVPTLISGTLEPPEKGLPLPDSNASAIFDLGGHVGAIFELVSDTPSEKHKRRGTAAAVHVDKRAYTGSCVNCSLLSSNWLECQCRRINNTWVWTWLWLPGCIANWNGYLNWQVSGNYHLSCWSQSLWASWFSAWCAGPSGNTWSEINLSAKIHNNDGTLQCYI